jgi:U32 family peptidase
MIELLAPAGDLARLKVAIDYGADAVYIGGQNYSLRANAHNFSLNDLKKAVLYAHKLHKKVYVTVNIVFHNNDLKGLAKYLINLDKIGVDAIIVSDIVVMKLHQQLKLKMALHISTQASILNEEAIKFYQSLGATRFVLAREASKENIKAIKDNTNAELECFIHGAMCTSFSGRCVLSNYATLRDSNRGGCVQVCRFNFNVPYTTNTYSITPKDLNMVPYIKEMMAVGVNSFKVEGRMRSIYYIATVISTYRAIINKISNNTLTAAYTKYYLDILNRCANRDSTPQFFNKLPGKDEQYYLGMDDTGNQDFLGIVKSYNHKTHIVTLEERNFFKINTKVEFFGPSLEPTEMIIKELFDAKGKPLEASRHPQEIVKFKANISLNKGDMMRLKVFDIASYL